MKRSSALLTLPTLRRNLSVLKMATFFLLLMRRLMVKTQIISIKAYWLSMNTCLEDTRGSRLSNSRTNYTFSVRPCHLMSRA
ncbi:hypothetical protein BDR07DRAFT_8104 [Suillus spraguei]|nr:hypothetical protein BDR07DRAFT_8104 [Suillus spraguei]